MAPIQPSQQNGAAQTSLPIKIPTVPTAIQGLQSITPPSQGHGHNFMAQNVPYGDSSSTDSSEDEDDDDGNSENELLEPSSEMSPLHIVIKTPININGDSNMMTLDMSEIAVQVAVGVVKAMKKLADDGLDIPMIDENGRPRPVTVETQAPINVTGSRNVIGTQKHISTMQKAAKVKAAEVAAANGINGHHASLSKGAPKVEDLRDLRKRDRAGSEDVEDAKRAKLE